MSFSHQPIMQEEVIDSRGARTRANACDGAVEHGGGHDNRNTGNYVPDNSMDNRIQETLKNKGKQTMEWLELSAHVLQEKDEIGIVEREKKGVEYLVPSAQKNIETLWKYLDDDSVGIIEVKGGSGIGKRWTACRVVERAVADNRFDFIIWVKLEYGNDADRLMLVQIADQLKLHSTRENEEGIEVGNSELRERISMTLAEKSYLMILCDFQDYDDYTLSSLGVPNPNTQSKRSKVLVLAASYLFYQKKSYLYFRGNRIYPDLNLFNLPKDEAWLLFCEKTGSQFDSLGIHDIAEALLKSCEGLPLKIVTLAGALKNVNDSTSPRLMVNVQKANKLIINRSMSHYEAMYEMLPSKEAKDCIVYCSSYPKHYRISVKGLITSWIAEGLLDKFNGLKAAHEKAQEILKELIDRHLIVRWDDSHVMMNTDIHLCFSSMIFLSLEKSGWSTRLTVPELHTEHESLRKISILNEKFESMYHHNATVSFAKSSNLLLYGKGGCLPGEIPDAFFTKMNHLQFLSILHAGIRYLPSSLSSLKNLGALVVRGCVALTNVDTIRELHSLVVLNLSGARSLKKLPDDFFKHMGRLKNLNLSDTQLKQLPSSFQYLFSIQRLILRGCSYLETLPQYVGLKLTVVDLSGAISLKEIPNEYIEDLKYLSLNGCSQIKTTPPGVFIELRELDLSKTQIVKVPFGSKYPYLVQLCLKSCEYLEELPHLELRKLEVLDLSGSTNFKRFQDDSFVNMRRLQILNFSATRVEKLPTLAECSLLSQLLLRDCTKLETLPHLEALKTLEVLDLSGSTSFMEFQDQSFRHMDELEIVNLSGTHIEKLPSFSKCPKLRQLLLKGCGCLQELPHLELERLEVLNLSGTQVAMLPDLTKFCLLRELLLRSCTKLVTIPHLESLERLEVLNLSGTQIAKLPDLTKLCFLRELLLRCCTKLVTIPHLESLERLEVLDLSGATSFKKLQFKSLENNFSIFSQCIACVPKLQKVDLTTSPLQIPPFSLPELQNLPQLFLRGCSRLLLQPGPEIPTKFEVLNFSCMQIRDFPDGSSKWTHLRFLGMSNQKFLWDFDWGKTKEVTKQLKFDPCESDDVGITSIHLISSDIKLFHFMTTSSELWVNYFKKFHYCLCSLEEWENEKDFYLHQRKVVFKDIFYPTSQIPHSTAPDHVFEICGFSEFPKIIDEVLSQVKILYLKKNSFITRLSDLGAGKFKVLRECWIERCDSMECAFYGEEKEENVAFGRVLENIWVSNLSKLRSLFLGAGDMQPGSFTCLKHLSIDCCPSLVTVFSSHLELVNLETLKIKFCDKLKNIFGESEAGEQILPKLNTLTLWRLPELQNICGGELPSLRDVRVKGCSKLRKLPVSANNDSSLINIRGELIWWDNLIWEDKGITSQLPFTELPRFL